MGRTFAGSAAVILISAAPVISSCAQAKEAWTAFPDSDPPAVQISKTAIDDRTVFLGGCNKLLGAGLTGTFSSAPASASWNAMSTTAISITGDIRISAEEIRFENGATLRLATTDRPGVMRVAKPANPVLKNGNVLCGREPPTFVVFGREERTESLDGSSMLYFKIYNGKEIPPSSDAIGMESKGRGFCALYNYTR